jgi:hypothetical protein
MLKELKMFYDPKWEKPTVIADEPWRKLLVEAAGVIKERGWHRGGLVGGRGAVCMLGALNAVAFGSAEPEEVVRRPNGPFCKAVSKLATTLCQHWRSLHFEPDAERQIATFNDNRCRSKQKVISLLLEAAAR